MNANSFIDQIQNHADTDSTNDKKFKEYCEEISFQYSDIIGSNQSRLTLDQSQIIASHNFCVNSGDNFLKAKAICQNSPSETCDFILSLDSSVAEPGYT